MHLTEIGVIFLLESFSRAGHTGGGEEGGAGVGRVGEAWGGLGGPCPFSTEHFRKTASAE